VLLVNNDPAISKSDVHHPNVQRPIRLAALFTAALCLRLAAPAVAQTAPYTVTTIVSETGGFAFTGAQTTETLDVLAGVVNAHGGINGRPLRFDFVDDQTNPLVAVQLANAAIAKGAQVILGPISAAACAAVVPLVAKNGPLDYCFSPVVTGPAGSYVFSVGPGTAINNVVISRFFAAKGWKRVGVIATTDASCRHSQRQIEAAMQLPENRGMQFAVEEQFNPTDLSVAAQVARLKSANIQALFTCASGVAFGTVVRGLHDGGLNVPTAASSANMDYKQLESYAGLLPQQLYFPAPRGLVPDPSLGKGPVKTAQIAFFDAFRKAHVRIGFQASQIWDATMLVVDALRHAGPDTSAAKLHDYIENQHDWAGIAGTYYFRDHSQRGITENALQIYGWDAAHDAFVVASREAGRLK
jgi:branched-chain amino acid transport system substrate-binding protein